MGLVLAGVDGLEKEVQIHGDDDDDYNDVPDEKAEV